MSGDKKKYVVAVDLGTTYMKCHLYDHEGHVVGRAQNRFELQYPSIGAVETDPETLWKQFVSVVKNAIADAKATPSDIQALGICTQRNTFITWDKDTGELFHNFITWQDTRASEICDQLNKSWMMTVKSYRILRLKYKMKGLHTSSKIMYTLSRNRRYLSGSIYHLRTAMVTPRILWAIDNFPKLKKRVHDKKVNFGCIDSWLLWKLTGGKVYATEISLASSTGMFDPYVNEWGELVLKSLGVPLHILPEVKETGHVFGYCSKDIFGAEFPIATLVGDQQAGTFGCCCFDRGSVKLTMGTGVFMDMNTAGKPHTSMHGIYPLVGWQLKNELVYLAESSSYDAGSVILWAQSIGLVTNVEETSSVAESVEDSGGVYFVPAFCGLQVPINDDQACAMFVGLKADTSKAQLVRAVLESLAFRVYQIYDVLMEESHYSSSYIRCVGGVSNNDFICQIVADLTNTPLSRMMDTEITSLGTAFLAGLATNFWQNKDELKKIAQLGKTFQPRTEKHREKLLHEYHHWQRAVQRSLSWY